MTCPFSSRVTEFAMLHCLMTHADAPCSVEQILRQVWGDSHQDAAGHVYTYIRRLRQNRTRDQPPEYIVGVYGKGYQFNHRQPAGWRN